MVRCYIRIVVAAVRLRLGPRLSRKSIKSVKSIKSIKSKVYKVCKVESEKRFMCFLYDFILLTKLAGFV